MSMDAGWIDTWFNCFNPDRPTACRTSIVFVFFKQFRCICLDDDVILYIPTSFYGFYNRGYAGLTHLTGTVNPIWNAYKFETATGRIEGVEFDLVATMIYIRLPIISRYGFLSIKSTSSLVFLISISHGVDYCYTMRTVPINFTGAINSKYWVSAM